MDEREEIPCRTETSVLFGQKQSNSYLELPSGAEVQPVCAARLYAYRSLGGFGAGISRLFSMC